jgi:hypothetical protein
MKEINRRENPLKRGGHLAIVNPTVTNEYKKKMLVE